MATRGVFCAGLHHVSDVDHATAGAPLDRRSDQCVVQVELSIVDLRLICFDGALQLADEARLLIELLLRLEPGRREFLVALGIELRGVKLGLVLLFGRLGLRQRRLERTWVDLEQRSPALTSSPSWNSTFVI